MTGEPHSKFRAVPTQTAYAGPAAVFSAAIKHFRKPLLRFREELNQDNPDGKSMNNYLIFNRN
jgi:hypothetical protein